MSVPPGPVAAAPSHIVAMMGGFPRSLLLLALVVALLVSGGRAFGQFGLPVGEFGDPAQFAPAEWPDRHLAPCRLMYTSVRSEAYGAGWRTDYPWAEINLMTRLSEITKTVVSRDSRNRPHAWVVRLTDDALFDCPYTVASDVGTMGLSELEAERLRLYLLKGGFLWVDDFWGTPAWLHWSVEIGKALPPSEYPIEDVPLNDPLLRTLIEVTSVPQVPSIRFWRAVGGQTTQERGDDSPHANLRAIRDEHGRIMVIMSHNTDLADSWEREGEDPEFFYRFSVDGYALGINVLLYALTH